MQNPLVSIIIPTYNRAFIIEETLNSIKAQTYTNWECIIVDDGSTDNTANILQKYCENDNRFLYCDRPNERPKGANACRNYGFELSKGEYINWFDSDDIMHQQKIEIQLQSLQKSSKKFAICQTLVFEYNISNVLGLRHEKIESKDPLDDFITLKFITLTQAPFFKRNFLISLSYLFDESLQAAQEWEFFVRILSKENKYEVEDKPLVYFRKHQNSISSNSNNKIKIWNYFLARYKVYSNDSIPYNNETSNYLENFMLLYFKKMIKNYYLKEAFCAFKLFILKNKRLCFKMKIMSLLAILSYKIFGRGETFLKKIVY